jgi:hypothetical protein
VEAVTAKVSYQYDEGEHDDPLPDVIWYRVDQSNGRWLYVDHPNAYRGGIPVGVQDVYQKDLSSEEARDMAAALMQAADEWDKLDAEIQSDRARFLEAIRHCEEDLGGHQWPPVGGIKSASDWACRRCGSAPQTSSYGGLGL